MRIQRDRCNGLLHREGAFFFCEEAPTHLVIFDWSSPGHLRALTCKACASTFGGHHIALTRPTQPVLRIVTSR